MSEENKDEIVNGYATMQEPSLADQLNAMISKVMQEHIAQAHIDGGIIARFMEMKAKDKASKLTSELFDYAFKDRVESSPEEKDTIVMESLHNSFNLTNHEDVKKNLMTILLSQHNIDKRLLEAWLNDDLIPDELKVTVIEPIYHML